MKPVRRNPRRPQVTVEAWESRNGHGNKIDEEKSERGRLSSPGSYSPVVSDLSSSLELCFRSP